MPERTEEDIVLQTGIKVKLGGRDYEIRPLVIKESREWRKKTIKLIASLPYYTNVTTDKPEEFEKAIKAIMVEMPDEVLNLFFAYAKDLDRDEIENIATDDEIANAFSEVIKLAFPLAQSLTKAMASLYQ